MSIKNIKKTFEYDISNKTPDELFEYLNECSKFIYSEKSKLLYKSKEDIFSGMFESINRLSNGEKSKLVRSYETCVKDNSLDSVSPIFWKFCPTYINTQEKNLIYFISVVYILLGCRSTNNDFASSLRNVLVSDSSKLKFERLLDNDNLEDFLSNSYSIFRIMKSNGVSFNFNSFFKDLSLFFIEVNNTGQKVKMKWAEEFYTDKGEI